MSLSIPELLQRLEGVRRQGDGFMAKCPAHDDRHQSLHVAQGDEAIVLKCHTGCSFDDVIAHLGIQARDLWPERGGGDRMPRRNGAGAQGSNRGGCTIAEYAEMKRLPVAFLEELGVTEFVLNGAPAVRIPYRMEDDSEGPVRFRVRLHKTPEQDGRFMWKKGSKVALYGLWRLAMARAEGVIVLVEGESDAHTLWFHKMPAIGLPGAATWREEWASALVGINQIFVVIEPDGGGEGVLRWLASSEIRHRAWLVRLPDAKDPSELHVKDETNFVARFTAALAEAQPWAEHARLEADSAEKDAWAQCSALARRPDILDDFAKSIEDRGVVGERCVLQLMFLAMVSRLLPRPVSLIVKGPSSSGKSHVTRQVLPYFPPSAFMELTGGSERMLAYCAESLEHRVIVLFEAAALNSEFGSYILRSLLSEGCVRYMTVEKTNAGMQSREIVKKGPTGLILTTTAIAIHPENETRHLSITVTDMPDQTRRILRALASNAPAADPADLDEWRALNEWLTFGAREVAIPFAEELADRVSVGAIRMRRDFAQVLSLVRAHALLHRASRATDATGRVVATLADYERVRELVAPIIGEGSRVAVDSAIRETVMAVAALIGQHRASPSVSVVARYLQLDDSTVTRRVQKAIHAGYLVNEEWRQGRKHRLRIGEPLPDDAQVLPPGQELVDGLPADRVGVRTPVAAVHEVGRLTFADGGEAVPNKPSRAD